MFAAALEAQEGHIGIVVGGYFTLCLEAIAL
jgi:hypothetical protein